MIWHRCETPLLRPVLLPPSKLTRKLRIDRSCEALSCLTTSRLLPKLQQLSFTFRRPQPDWMVMATFVKPRQSLDMMWQRFS